jgi:hypothetical protein
MDTTKQQLLADTFMVGIDPAKKKLLRPTLSIPENLHALFTPCSKTAQNIVILVNFIMNNVSKNELSVGSNSRRH